MDHIDDGPERLRRNIYKLTTVMPFDIVESYSENPLKLGIDDVMIRKEKRRRRKKKKKKKKTVCLRPHCRSVNFIIFKLFSIFH